MSFMEYSLGAVGMWIFILFAMPIIYNSEHPVFSILIAGFVSACLLALIYYLVILIGGVL